MENNNKQKNTEVSKPGTKRPASNGMEKKKFTIDAKGRALGRVASEAASILLGKNSIDFEKNKVLPHEVSIVNASLLLVTAKKLKEKEYVRYSGYPGGLKNQTMGEIVSKKGMKEVVRKAVLGMIPDNKLRDIRMKNLIITE